MGDLAKQGGRQESAVDQDVRGRRERGPRTSADSFGISAWEDARPQSALHLRRPLSIQHRSP